MFFPCITLGSRCVRILGAVCALYAADACAGSAFTSSSWAQQAKLVAEIGVKDARFGFGTALQGETALVSQIDGDGLAPGTISIFARSDTEWTRHGTIVPAERFNGDGFGTAMAWQGDTLVVGGVSADAGRAHVFIHSAGTWTEQAELVPNNGPGGSFYGASVALDGDTALVGSLGYDDNRGTAYVFRRSGTVWMQEQQLFADEPNADFFGRVALAGDRALIGAAFASGGRGDVFVFERSDTTWTQTTKLDHADGGPTDLFGQSVVMQADTAVVGAPGFDGSMGAAYVYVLVDDAWSFQATLTADDRGSGDGFAQPVSLDGDTIVAGAGYAMTNAPDQGAAYVFQRSGTTWLQVDRLVADDGAQGDLFSSTSISQDQGTILISSAYSDLGAAMDAGAAYVFAPLGDVVFASGFE